MRTPTPLSSDGEARKKTPASVRSKRCQICKEGAWEEGAEEDTKEGTQHLATHVFILALSLLLQLMAFLSP